MRVPRILVDDTLQRAHDRVGRGIFHDRAGRKPKVRGRFVLIGDGDGEDLVEYLPGAVVGRPHRDRVASDGLEIE